MIKANKGKVTIKGSTPEILTNMTLIIKSVNKMLVDKGCTEEDAKAIVSQGFEMATMTEKELEMNFLGKLKDVLEKVCNEIEGREEEEHE